MRTRAVILVVCSILTVGQVPAGTQDPAGAKRVQKLIDQLGSNQFSDRDRAMKELETFGAAALPVLRKALKSASSAEALRRVQVLVGKLEDQELAAKLLSPRRVHLNPKDTRLKDAVAELVKQSGCPVHLSDWTIPNNALITLDTGETTFWDAFQQLCKAAGLVENQALMGPFDAHDGLPPIQDSLRIMQAAPGIHLTVGKPAAVPTCVAGSIRIRLVKTVAAPGDAVDLVLEVSGEPRLHGLAPAGSVHVVKALDEMRQPLASVAPDPPAKERANQFLAHRGGGWVVGLHDGTILKGNTFGAASPIPQGPFLTTVRLLRGEKMAKRLTEMTAKLALQTTVEAQTPMIIDRILQAAGQSVKAADGSRLTVLQVEPLQNKDVRVELTWERGLGPSDTIGLHGLIGGRITAKGGKVEIGGVPGDRSPAVLADAPRLLDVDDKEWTLAEWSSQGWTITRGQMLHRLTLLYRPQPGQAAPAQLVVPGQRVFTLETTFTLRDVPLP